MKHFLLLILVLALTPTYSQVFRVNTIIGMSYAKTSVTTPDYIGTSKMFAEETLPQALSWAQKQLLGQHAPEPELEVLQKNKIVGGLRPQLGVEAGLFDDIWNIRAAVLTTKYSNKWYLPNGVSFEGSVGVAPLELGTIIFNFRPDNDFVEFLSKSFFLNFQYNWDSGRNPVLDFGFDGTKQSNLNLVFELRRPIDNITFSLFQALSINNGGHFVGLRLIYTKD